MNPLSRRSFLGASLAGFSTGHLLGQDTGKSSEPEKFIDPTRKPIDDYAFNPATLFLTWHTDPTTTMDIQWIGTTGETADTKISYRRATAPATAPATVPATANISGLGAAIGGMATGLAMQGPRWTVVPTLPRPYTGTDFKVFRAELTGLTPNADYEFTIGKSSPTWRFRTMPAKATNAISFISGGDVGVNAHAVANNIQAARQDPMFCVIGGDLGYDNGKSADISIAFIRNYSRHMVGKNGRLIPMVVCIGNHEVAGGYNQPREKAPFFFALFDGMFADASYATLDFGDYLSLVMLDTGHIASIGGEQTDWLEKTLAARKDHPNLFVVNHVPAYPSFRVADPTKEKPGAGTANRKHWVPLFDKYRVPVVLEHHDHTFKRTRPMLNSVYDANGVQYLGDGSWGRLRSPVKAEKLDYLATVSEDYHLSLHRIQGQERYHLALDENGRVMDVARSGQRTTSAVRVKMDG